MQSHNLSVDGLTRHTRYYVAADYLQPGRCGRWLRA